MKAVYGYVSRAMHSVHGRLAYRGSDGFALRKPKHFRTAQVRAMVKRRVIMMMRSAV
jgi:hypothetical protein